VTPDDALWWWEKSHHALTETHRESFKRRISASGLLEHEAWVVQHAIRQNKRLDDALRAVEAIARNEPQQGPVAPDSTPRPTPKPMFKQLDWKPAPQKSKNRKSRRSSGSARPKKPMENTDAYRSASGSGSVRRSDRKAQPATSSDERATCKACDRPAMNCIC